MSTWDLLTEGRCPRRYQAGQLVYLQGTQPKCFYYLSTGSVRSFISTDSGEERVLTIHRTGDLMGEASFFDGCPRVTSAMTLEECLILPVDQQQLDAAFQRHPELAMPMLRHLARTVRTLSGHVGAASLPAHQRVARCLLSQPADSDSVIHSTHEALGQAAGLSRVTISRVLGELSAQGVVALGYRAVKVLDWDALNALAFET